MEIIRNN